MKRYLQNHKLNIVLIFTLFAVIYGLTSFVNHYYLRTYALDLGVFNHAVYSYAHFKKAVFTLGIDGNEVPFLGTHFSPVTILYVPFYYIFGSYALLVVQILAILLGGMGIYRFASDQFGKKSIYVRLILIQFFSIWGIYSALSFDFHNNVVAAMLVIWFTLFLEKRKVMYTCIFFCLILLAKENMAIWMIFILLGLMIKNRKLYFKSYVKLEIPLMVISLLYAIIVIGFIMPELQGADDNLQFSRYSNLGSSLGEILLTIVQKPLDSLSLLFKNTLEDPVYDGIKTELHFMVLVSGGICLFFRPAFLVMLIPIYAQKLFSNDYNFWGINLQYSIEFVPIISLAFIDFLKHIQKYKKQVAIAITLSTIIFNINTISHRKSKWYNKTNTMFYGKRHYSTKLDLKAVKRALEIIENSSSVSASSCLVPRLAFREKIYHFPIVKNAEFIVLLTNSCSTYPITEDEFTGLINEYRKSDEFSVMYDDNDLLIFKREDQAFH